MPATLILYGTSCCHLCEQAETVLHHAGISADRIDVSEDDELLERYGTRIPVVKRQDNDKELGWPFDEMALIEFTLGV